MTDFSISTSASTSSALDARTSQVTRAARSQDAQQGSKMEKSAKEFEAILLGRWLEDAQKSFSSVPGSDPNKESDPGADNFRSMGMQAVATSMANSGGLGIASMIVKYMNRSAAPVSQDPVSQSTAGGDKNDRK